MKITHDQIIKAADGPYPMSLVGRDREIVTKAVNIGIDSRLEACFVIERGDSYEDAKGRLNCVVSPESLPVLVKRLTEMDYEGRDGDDADVGGSLASDILGSIGIDVETGCYEVAGENA